MNPKRCAVFSKLFYYKSIEVLESRCVYISACHFLLYLLFYITLSFLSTLMRFASNPTNTEEVFLNKFEKYFVLATAMYMLMPFVTTTMLIFGLLNKNCLCISVSLKILTALIAILCISLTSIGIFLFVKGTIHVAGITISFSFMFGLFTLYSVVQMNDVLREYRNDPQKRESNLSCNSNVSTCITNE